MTTGAILTGASADNTMSRVMDWGDQITPLNPDGRTPILHEAGCSADHDRLWELANGHIGFYGWLRLVNARCRAIDRITAMDLPPRDWREEYDGRVPPEEAADVALDEYASVHGVPHILAARRGER